MRQRRVRINPTIKSSYNASWKNHCETAPHKIKPKLSMNMEQEHRKNPLRALSSITDKTLYRADFEDQVDKIATIRSIMDDRKNGKDIKHRGKKPHIDMIQHAPTSRSQYRAAYPAVEIKDILIEATPQYPRYSLRWLGNSESRNSNKNMQQSLQHFKRRNIVVTEPKQPF
jgi:hypothetical protein